MDTGIGQSRRLLKNKSLVPFENGRHVWRFEAEAGWLEAKTFRGLVELVRKHREANNLPGADAPEAETGAEVEGQICSRLPAEQSYEALS